MPRDVAKIYVGNLGRYGNSDELHREFSHYGDVKNVWVARQPPGFAFVEMSDYSDAEYAVMKLHERIICGQRVRVEMSHGRSSSNKFSSERRRRRLRL